MTLPYIIKVALILGACLSFYKILLRRETFYKMNRFTLMTCLFIAFSLPLVKMPQQLSFQKPVKETVVQDRKPALIGTDQVEQNISTVGSPQTDVITIPPAARSKFSFAQAMNWLFWLYWFGVLVFGISFLFQIFILLWRAYRNPVIMDGKYRIVEVSGDKAPCSFGNNIFINPEKYDWDTYNQIIQHEKIHIRQKHTLDILFAELVLIFQWFNPFAWIYRREIESNLEFLTDDQLMQQKVDKASYQLSLLKVSAPHLPLSLTTNYNQSILKKRIAMMNTKRSNLHTSWKYLFLLPVLAILAALLNEPVARSQGPSANNERPIKNRTISTEGYWFAVIKDDKINIRFSDDKDVSESFDLGKGAFSSTTFKLSELSNVPTGAEGKFTIKREAGTMEMTGKFEGSTGMGRFKFVADAEFVNHMNTELKDKLEEDEQMAFFFIDVKKSYLAMLRSAGYYSVSKDELIPLAALKIDATYIDEIRKNGFKDVELDELVPLKAMNITAAYIKEIREAGYKNITTDQLISFKAQNIDKDYINKVRTMKGKDGKDLDDDADDIVSLKAMNIDEEFVNSFKALGYTNIPHDQLVSMKAIGVTAEYIKGWHSQGFFKDVDPERFVGLKSMSATPEYLKSFIDLGFKNVDPENLTGLRAMGITPDYIKSFDAMGYKRLDLDEYVGLKSQHVTPEYVRSFEQLGYKSTDLQNFTGLKAMNVTPEYIKSFESAGFKNIDLDEIIAVKSLGITPAWITSMKEKGFNYTNLQKYVTLKSLE